MTYPEILKMVGNSANNFFHINCKDIHTEIIESATKIYIKQMELDFAREKLEKENK